MRAVVPNVLTAARIPLGAAAVVAATEDRLVLAATLITIGGVTDGIDGWAARRLGVSGPFGALFDCFCDYLCFVVAPWMLTRTLLAAETSSPLDALLMLPLLTAAVRYARNGLIVSTRAVEIRELPGLGTVFFAFLSVAAVFLDRPQWLNGPQFAWGMTTLVVLFSVLMIAPITYPKLTAFRGASPVVIVLLACMPFVATEFLAAVMLVVGLLYAIAAPFLVRRGPPTAP
jgi:phosphatidylserine synthase